MTNPPREAAAAVVAESRDRLPLPDRVELGRIRWSYLVPIALIHLLALLAVLPWLFSWTGLIVMLVGVHVFGQGINLGYHRMLGHRSLAVPLWFERVLVVIALCCMEDTPGKWVATHRYHHNHADTHHDPHSPLVAFIWAHVGWLLFENPATHSVETYRKYASDVLKDPVYLKLEKTYLWVWIYVAHAALYFLVGAACGALTGGTATAAVQFGLSLLVWGVFVRTVVVWHITWSVNSLTHVFGYTNYKTGENSRNNWLVALVTVGEGWHNNHHHDPASASVQHRWWEIDVTYYEIRLLQWLGLARAVVPPKRERRAAQARAQAQSLAQAQAQVKAG